ncbi:hypothetical protein PoB_007160600 [Plakobranchus ocellatus]|uniref:Uncharacterized protein n=1 Tax=Plakobranchus ocellatus TaxID=259542 RepID=A0AAV4DMC4_9GAST|nr:hypothetical protein PoB_007160600 [Plakobranchus ocellatus]
MISGFQTFRHARALVVGRESAEEIPCESHSGLAFPYRMIMKRKEDQFCGRLIAKDEDNVGLSSSQSTYCFDNLMILQVLFFRGCKPSYNDSIIKSL